MSTEKQIVLSPEQAAVRDSDAQFIVVAASAGSGKTEVVAQRVERLLAEQRGFKIIALSYTRRAARELHERFTARVKEDQHRVEADTIHGFAQNLLLRYGTWIGLPRDPLVLSDDADRVELLREWQRSTGLPPDQDGRGAISRIDLDRALGRDTPQVREWNEALEDAQAVDFESMLSKGRELLRIPAVAGTVGRTYRHLVIDEAQNLTPSQMDFLEALIEAAGNHMNVVLVGDDKQSIVGFAGADPKCMRHFAERHDALQFRLKVNFRSARAIVELSDRVATVLQDRPSEPQEYAAHGSVEFRDFQSEREEAAAVANWVSALLSGGLPAAALAPGESARIATQEIAVLGRTTNSLRGVSESLTAAGIKVAIATHPDDWLASELGRAAWLLATFRPESRVSQRRVERLLATNAETRTTAVDGLPDPLSAVLQPLTHPLSPEKFVRFVASLEGSDEPWQRDKFEILDVWQKFCDRADSTRREWSDFQLFVSQWQASEEDSTGVRLQTVHKSQGREYRAVSVVGLNDGQFPDFRARTDAEMEAELRAFYVAVTRSSRILQLTRPATIRTRNGLWTRDPSPFIRFVSPGGS